MENTIGIIIYDITGKILITKPTNGNIWSFPKGLPDSGEDFKTTALREVLEETSLDLTQIKGSLSDEYYSQIYKKRPKKVNLFIFKASEEIETHFEIQCDSCFENNGVQIPENDDAKWVFPIDALNYIHEAQKEILLRLIYQIS